jgi:hypothetical protein
MPSISEKLKVEALKGLEGTSRDEFVPFVAQSILEQYGADFKILLQAYIKARQISGSGQLADNITSEVDNEKNKLTIKMLDYFDFPNEGVRGWGSSKNAQASPYTYRRKAKKSSNGQFQANIKEYILSGKAKVRNVQSPVGLERKVDRGKKKSLIDRQVDNLIYMIKRYGIKRTEYFNDAFEEAFKDIDVVMGEALGIDIAMNIQTISSKKVK